MQIKINKSILPLLATPFLFSAVHANAAYQDERYGLTALTADAQAQSVQSCTPGTNAISRQISTGSTDIQGPLPFVRTYETALQLGFNKNYRSSTAKSIDSAFPLTYLETRAMMGAGWSHNYDFRLNTIGTQAYTLNMPGFGLPLVFAKQSDGSMNPTGFRGGSTL